MALFGIACSIGGCSLLLTPEATPSAQQSHKNSYHSPASKRLIKSGALLIDVRSPDEFAEEHLPNAINIPYTQIKSSIAKAAPNRGRSIVVYCSSGRRSEIARQDLVEIGYSQVTNGGGIEDLK